MNKIIIEEDGWVYIEYKSTEYKGRFVVEEEGLGDLGVDVEIEDRRKKHE